MITLRRYITSLREMVMPRVPLLLDFLQELRTRSAARPTVPIACAVGLALICTVGVSHLISAPGPAPEVVPAAEYIPDAGFTPDSETAGTFTPGSDKAVFSHRKLLQVGVAKTGAPVYRFVECRHLPKEESKLVQVGVVKNGLPMYRIKRGDYCLFAENQPESAAAAQASAPITRVAMTSSGKVSAAAIERYVCEKFGPACEVALAIRRAENPSGACEAYHYNTSDGTLDWGYFQINSVHLQRPGLNLRDLLDCRKNIEYAYQLYLVKGFEPWTTYTSGLYRKFLPSNQPQPQLAIIADSVNLFRRIGRTE